MYNFDKVKEELLKGIPKGVKTKNDMIDHLIYCYYQLDERYCELNYFYDEITKKLEEIKSILNMSCDKDSNDDLPF